MRQEILDSYKEFSDSFDRLKSSSKQAKEEFEKDNVLKRFKLTFELFLKNLAIILKGYKVNCKYPTDYIRTAVKFGILNNENTFLEMLEDKYKITNETKLKTPEELYKKIRIKYIIILGKYLEKIGNDYINNKNSDR